jgi:large subunit ribosomal protein L25
MHKEATLAAQRRTQAGSAACRRLRREGLVPGNVYGHNAPPVPVTIPGDALKPVILGGVRVVDLELDGETSKALLREVQWDTFGVAIQHFDFMRVDPNERVTLVIPLELKGTAAGAVGGGVLEQPLHSITVDCLAYQIPDAIPVRISSLDIGQAIHVKDLEIPENVHVHNPADAIVVHVIQVQTKEIQPVEAIAGAAEPELVGKKPAAEAAPEEKEAGGKKK